MFASVIVAGLSLRIDRISGNLVPKFVPRWSKPSDELLETPTEFVNSVDLSIAQTHDFPQFLGPGRDQQVRGIRLAGDWNTRQPEILWHEPIGAGWSAFSAVNGFAVTMEQRGNLEMTSCYEIATGRMVWWQGNDTRFQEIRGGVGPRSTPTIHDGRVYSLGATGLLNCIDGRSGDVIWQQNLLEEVETTLEEDQGEIVWGRSASPLIVDDKVIVPGGGPPGGPYANLLAYDKQSGAVVWRGGQYQISYSSPQVANIDGVRQILIVNEDTVTGHDATTGEVLWEFDWPGASSNQASVSQAVPMSENRILVSKAYGGGAMVVKVTRNDEDRWSVDVLWHEERLLKTKLTNVCIQEPFAFGLSDGILECVDLNAGKRRWKRGRYGHGQILMVDDLLLVQSERGKISLVEASPEGCVVHGEIQAVSGQAWNHLCLYGSYLLVRSDQEATCLDLPLE